LALDPGNAVAFEALRSKAKEIRVVPHSVRQGETLASIAELYYGDRSRAEVIRETNQLPPNPKLKPGLSLRIPEIPGVPFLPQRDPRSAPSPGIAPATKPDLSPVDPGYVNPLLADAKDALDSGDFVTALAGVDQFLATNPKNAAGLDLKKTVLYTQGRTLLDQKKYQESLQVFNQLARISPNYQDSNTLSGQAKARLVQEHYSEGIRFFRDEKLREAIARWRTVLQYEPNHAGAKKNIAQAERMLENLERQKTKR
jgi:tetratricopeptide (TPR) repeat protein